ncbi:MAG: hypothetical protein HYR75_00485 [Gemmatimonadetes bacterium]|nr:hypothetical protein [Gemmatimonadota bacterium]MBI3504589.1 hypothetical protein [Pseudomonadota bacterium]
MDKDSKQRSLKPVDVVVALALATNSRGSVKAISLATGVSSGETHNSFNRLALSGLISPADRSVDRDRLTDFLEYGVPVAFPPIWLPATRGVATCRFAASAAPETATSGAIVWPAEDGASRGRGLTPLYGHASTLPSRNPELYELLSTLDVVRTGSVRERRLAMEEIRLRLAGDTLPTRAPDGDVRTDEVSIPTAIEAVARVATALRPILNRVIFSGRAAAELLVHPAGQRRRLPEDATLSLLTSVSLDRIAADLRALGLERTARGDGADSWRFTGGVSIEIRHVETGVEDVAPWNEYAMLLTQDTEIEPGFVVRVTGGAATAALLLDRHASASATPYESLAAEDLMVLVGGREQLVEEVRGAPLELRAFVAARTAALLRSGSASALIQRTDPDAAAFPAMVAAVSRRLQDLASLA